jgi:type II secretory pathway pseudopilin PulG
MTLVEILVVMAITSVVLGAVSVGFTSALTSQAKTTKYVAAQQNARLVLQRLRKDIHCAISVSDPEDTGTGGFRISLTQLQRADVCPGLAGSSAVEWCTRRVVTGVETRWQLFRDDVTSCNPANSTFQIDYLVQPNPWTIIDRAGVSCSSTEKWRASTVGVRLWIDLAPDRVQSQPYLLTDEIALRNSTRRCS